MTGLAYHVPVVSCQSSVTRNSHSVILSEGTASLREAVPKSKDPYTVLNRCGAVGNFACASSTLGTFAALSSVIQHQRMLCEPISPI